MLTTKEKIAVEMLLKLKYHSNKKKKVIIVSPKRTRTGKLY